MPGARVTAAAGPFIDDGTQAWAKVLVVVALVRFLPGEELPVVKALRHGVSSKQK